MRFNKSPQLPGAGRTSAWHHHESHTPTSPGAILLTPNIFTASVLGKFARANFSGRLSETDVH